MLLKLLKYEIKSSYGRFILAFLVYICVAAVLLIFFRNYQIFNTSLLIFGIIAIWVITFLTIFQRYNTNLYGNEGYLMLTLPVDGRILLASKLISALVWLLMLSLIVIPSIMAITYCYSDINLINSTHKFIEQNKQYTTIVAVEYILGIIRSILEIYFSISISKLPIWRKFGILAGFGTYILAEVLNSIPFFLIKKTANYMDTTVGLNGLAQLYPINNLFFQCFFDLFIFVVLFFATSYLLDNRTSLK